MNHADARAFGTPALSRRRAKLHAPPAPPGSSTPLSSSRLLTLAPPGSPCSLSSCSLIPTSAHRACLPTAPHERKEALFSVLEGGFPDKTLHAVHTHRHKHTHSPVLTLYVMAGALDVRPLLLLRPRPTLVARPRARSEIRRRSDAVRLLGCATGCTSSSSTCEFTRAGADRRRFCTPGCTSHGDSPPPPLSPPPPPPPPPPASSSAPSACNHFAALDGLCSELARRSGFRWRSPRGTVAASGEG